MEKIICFQIDVHFIVVMSDVTARCRAMISRLRRRFLLQIIFLLYDCICAYWCFSHCAKAEMMTVTFMVCRLCMYTHADVCYICIDRVRGCKVSRVGCNSIGNSEPEALHVGLIRSGHGLLRIDGKSNNLLKKEVHFMFTEIGC